MIFKEKRKYARFPVMKDMIEPILIRTDKKVEKLPALMHDLSAGGMGIITFKELKPKTRLMVNISLPGIKMKNIQAEVIWTKKRSETYRSGIKFIDPPQKYVETINKLATDYLECEIKIALGVGEICVRNCRYRKLCEKREKK